MPLVKLKNTSNQFELKLSDFYFIQPHWSTYDTTWLSLNLIYFHFFSFFFLKVEALYTMINIDFSFCFHWWLPLYPLLEVFPNVVSEQHTFKSMNLRKSIRIMLHQRFNILHELTLGNNHNDPSETSYVKNKFRVWQQILSKQTKSTLWVKLMKSPSWSSIRLN